TMWQFERMLVGSPVVYKSWRAYGGGDKVAEWETTRQRQRRLYTYNAAGRVSHVLSLRYFGTTLDSSTQSFFFYNAAGGVVKDSLVVFDRTTRQWTPINQIITTYDGAGKVTLIVQEDIIAGVGTRRGSRREYTYDSNGNIVE